MVQLIGGRLTYSHDFYLKAYQLSGPRIDADVVLVDEAQDLAPVLADIVAHQTHAQLILVGDPWQSIYGWLGAVDAMNTIAVDSRCYLTQSFRFGPPIAAVANGILARLNADLRLRGHQAINSNVGPIPSPRAVLARTNAEALRQLLHHLAQRHRVALVGGNTQMARFCQAAADLKTSGVTGHPDLACFTSWGQVVDYVTHDHQGGELKLLVQLIDTFGAPRILDALAKTVAEDNADVVISTAHKSKGREWNSVALAGDYPPPPPDRDDNTPEELRLLCVAVTRARHHLDTTRVPHATRHPNRQPAPPGPPIRTRAASHSSVRTEPAWPVPTLNPRDPPARQPVQADRRPPSSARPPTQPSLDRAEPTGTRPGEPPERSQA